jgi:3'(2'), 5'-bisphosphate nucleotidase
MTREYDRLAERFAAIASDAGVAVMEVYRSAFTSRTKADMSPVSDADERAEDIILSRLAAEMPGVPVIAEEAAAREGLATTIADAFILVDPVDGTREFIQKTGDFTVNIALIVDGSPRAGCVFAPARRQMHFAGSTSFLIRDFEAGAKPEGAETIHARPYPRHGLTAVVSASHLDPQTEAFLGRFPIASRTGVGSSLKFCLLALGEADLYPRFGRTMEWDTAAGQAVLSAAGGCVTTPDGAPFLYGKAAEGFANGAFIAWGDRPL